MSDLTIGRIAKGRFGRGFSPPYGRAYFPCGLWGIMSKAERASLDKYRDRDLHVSGGRLTRPLAMSSGRNGASSVEVLFSLQRRLRPRR